MEMQTLQLPIHTFHTLSFQRAGAARLWVCFAVKKVMTVLEPLLLKCTSDKPLLSGTDLLLLLSNHNRF